MNNEMQAMAVVEIVGYGKSPGLRRLPRRLRDMVEEREAKQKMWFDGASVSAAQRVRDVSRSSARRWMGSAGDGVQ